MKFQIYARGIIFNQIGDVLLIKKRTDQKYAAGKWIFPGGTLEWGEDIEETLARELKEEINAQVSTLKMIGTRKMMTDDIHWQGIYYKVTVGDLNSLRNCEENKHECIAWFSVDRLPLEMDEIDRKHIALSLLLSP